MTFKEDEARARAEGAAAQLELLAEQVRAGQVNGLAVRWTGGAVFIDMLRSPPVPENARLSLTA